MKGAITLLPPPPCLNGMHMESFTLCLWFVRYGANERKKSRGFVPAQKKNHVTCRREKQISPRIMVGRAP